MRPQVRAAIYTRISEDRTAEGLGVARQDEDCRALCDRKGWQVVGTYTDNDISAYSAKRRPQYQRLLQAVKNGEIDTIVAWHPDRLHRSPIELESFINVVEAANVNVAIAGSGDTTYDLTTPEGRMTARILGSVARHESEHKSQRIARKCDELARDGKWSGGTPGFGYKVGTAGGLIVDQAEADLIRQGVAAVLAGKSMNSVVDTFTASGLKGARQGRWDPRTLKAIFTSPRIAGLRVHRGEVVGKGQWEPIISEAQLRQVQAVYESRRGTRTVGRQRVLAGMLVCGECGARMQSLKNTVPSFACQKRRGGCGAVIVREAPVDKWIKDKVLDQLARTDLSVPMDDTEILDRLAADKAQLQQLASDYAQHDITHAEWMTARKIIESRIHDDTVKLAHSSREVAGADQYRGRPDLLEKLWVTLSTDDRRAVISALFTHITVARVGKTGRRFDSDRLAAIPR